MGAFYLRDDIEVEQKAALRRSLFGRKKHGGLTLVDGLLDAAALIGP
jgi:hypothetical protein